MIRNKSIQKYLFHFVSTSLLYTDTRLNWSIGNAIVNSKKFIYKVATETTFLAMGSSKKHKEKDKDREHKKKRKHRSRSRSKERKKHRHDRDRDYSDRERYRRDEEYPENDDSYPRELEDVDTRGSLKGNYLTKLYGFG